MCCLQSFRAGRSAVVWSSLGAVRDSVLSVFPDHPTGFFTDEVRPGPGAPSPVSDQAQRADPFVRDVEIRQA